jgi:hypothetical protein
VIELIDATPSLANTSYVLAGRVFDPRHLFVGDMGFYYLLRIDELYRCGGYAGRITLKISR